MLRPVSVLLLLCGALALPAYASTVAPPAPSGQFLPSADDRDGDGLSDATDCAPDDPTRPARGGVDGNCDGAADGGQQAASGPSSADVDAAAVARQAAHGSVAALRWPLGGALAVFAVRHDAAGDRTFVFVARDNVGLTVTHRLDRERTATNERSLGRGSAYVLRVAVGKARTLRVAVTVIDAAGNSRRVARTLRLR